MFPLASLPKSVLPGLVLAAVAASSLAPPARGQVPQPSFDGVDTTEPLAWIDGVAVTVEEAKEAATQEWEQAELQRLQCHAKADRNQHQALINAVERLLQERLIQAEAAAAQTEVEDWFKAQIESYSADVSAEEVDGWYQANRANIRQPKEQIAPQIRTYLANGKLIRALKDKHDIRTNVQPYRVDVASEGFPAKGPADAAVTIVEFSDFECPYCKTLNPTLHQVLEEYGEHVRLVFRQYPLVTIHPNAQKAAEAALCAREQEHFWPMHDLLFGDQTKLAPEDLKARASELELDMEKFNECFDSGQQRTAIREDVWAGVRVGVTGTPALYVNGRILSGVVAYERLAAVIDDELERRGIEREGK